MSDYSNNYINTLMGGDRVKSEEVPGTIKDERNWRYCEKCIVIDLQSHEIVHEIVHEHGET